MVRSVQHLLILVLDLRPQLGRGDSRKLVQKLRRTCWTGS